MIVGLEKTEHCPACNSDATWQNRDMAWLIKCPMCETFLIRNTTIEILKGSIPLQVLAGDLLKESHDCNYLLTREKLVETARRKWPKATFQRHFPSDSYE